MTEEIKIMKAMFVELEPHEIAMVLDCLSVKPYNQVSVLINKIIEQVRSANPPELPEGDADPR